MDDLTITGNFPTACTQRRPSKGKRMRKNRNLTQCVKDGRQSTEERLVDEKMLVSEGESCCLFRPAQILRVGRASALSLLSHLPPFSPPAGSAFALPARLHTSTWRQGAFHCRHRTTSHSWHCSLQNPKTGFHWGRPPSLTHGLL